MTIKRIFGTLLTVLGISGFIFTAIQFVNSNGANNVKVLGMYGVFALIFFSSGVRLVHTTKN